MPQDFAVKARPTIEQQLLPDERLVGIAAATQAKMFSGQAFAIGATTRRLILQPPDTSSPRRAAWRLGLTPSSRPSSMVRAAAGSRRRMPSSTRRP